VIAGRHLRELFAADPKRAERFAVEAGGVYLDHSKNLVIEENLRLLLRPTASPFLPHPQGSRPPCAAARVRESIAPCPVDVRP